MNEPDQVFVVCVGEHEDHIRESILTECVRCNRRVWVSITNCDKKALCMPCVRTVQDPEFYITKETIEEAIREKDRVIKGRGKQKTEANQGGS